MEIDWQDVLSTVFGIILPLFILPLGAWIALRNSQPHNGGLRQRVMQFSAITALASFTCMGVAVVIALLKMNNYFAIRLIQASAVCTFISLPAALFGKGPGRVLIGAATFTLTIGLLFFMREAELFGPPEPAGTHHYVIHTK
jgi:cytochrome bd-type quinol oxidase subunit 2